MKAFPGYEYQKAYDQMMAVGGMELRDYFAAKAMQAFLSKDLPEGHTWNKEGVSKDAYDMADFMMKARVGE